MRTRAVSATIVVVFLFIAAPSGENAGADATVVLEPLGALGGSWSSATAINADGIVVGAAETPDHQSHAFVARPAAGALQGLGTLGGRWSAAYAINEAGVVVGNSARFDGRAHAFATDPDTGALIDLGTLGGLSSTAFGVNATGTIVGASQDGSGSTRAFVYREETGMLALGTLGGGSSQAFGLNADGVVVGESRNGLGQVRGFRASNGTLEDLGTLGGPSSRATAINDTGQITGSAMTASGEEHAFRFDPGAGLTDLGTLGGSLSSGEAINRYGHVAGWSIGVDGAIYAFVWTPATGMVDLNSLVPLPPGVRLVAAYGINDAGQVAGYGVFDGEWLAFRVTFPEEPGGGDVTGPAIESLEASPSVLWPPRHDLVPVTLVVSATDDSGEAPVCAVSAVASSEPDVSAGQDDVPGDTAVVGALAVLVRAERLESGPGRTYTIAVTCADAAGNESSGTATVQVPRSGGTVKAGGKNARR